MQYSYLSYMNPCGLCGENKSLRKSHIIPKFVFDWIKETGTGALRSGGNMNLRIQDGPKVPFLCHDCELTFSKSEKYFSHIFRSIVSDVDTFTYTTELNYFAFSVLWRLLKIDVIINERQSSFYDLLKTAEVEWRDYLFNGNLPTKFRELHLFIAVDPLRDEDLEEHKIQVPDTFIQYMGRMTDGGLGEGDNKCMVYFKLPRMLFIAPIAGFNITLYKNTLLNIDGGVFKVNTCRIEDEDIGSFLFDRAMLIGEKLNGISNTQREILRDRSQSKLSEVEKKDLGRILKYNKKRYK